MMFHNSLYFVLYFVGLTLVLVKSEFFTAIVDMENLLYTEGEIVKTLKQYLELEEQRLEKVRRLTNEYAKLYEAANNDFETFLYNPVNAYLLVKRLTADWKVAENLINGSSGRALIENIIHLSDLKFPEDEDLSGAASALMRLQDTYLLNTSTLARGRIEGTAPSPELTSGDCFELGRQAFNNKNFNHTVLWMQEALERIENENIKTSKKVDILEYMAYSTFMLGNIRHAAKLTKDLLYINPDHPRAHGNLAYYTDVLAKSGTQENGDDGQLPSELIATLAEKPKDHPEFDDYERLCRGEKVRLRRATVQTKESGEFENTTLRISKSAWLEDDIHEVVERVGQRIEAITGLTTDTAEELQVVNYGIGGQYVPHFDFAEKYQTFAFKYLGTGNRIATWINYMSNVDAGGATVFPTIGVQVKPIKGSAAFWYNLYKNGDGDMDTRHAACPVLAGSKWISNKWFHEKGQEFRRPCSLDPDE